MRQVQTKRHKSERCVLHIFSVVSVVCADVSLSDILVLYQLDEIAYRI